MFNLKINNFRGFLNQQLSFSRINILIGENSGGKSSILKLLLALKQTVDAPTEVNLKLSGDYTDLGNYEEVIYYKKKGRKLSFSFESSEAYYNYFVEGFMSVLAKSGNIKTAKDLRTEVSFLKNSSTEILFEFTSKLNDHSSIKTVITNNLIGTLEIVQNKEKYDLGSRELNVELKFNFLYQSGVVKKCYATKEGFFSMLGGEFRKTCRDEYGELGDKLYNDMAYLLIMQNFIQGEINKINFVNPIGTTPKRLYFQEDKKNTYKSIDIEKFINILGDRSLSLKGYTERIALLNEIIKEFGIAEEIEIIRDKILPVLALNVKTKDFWSNITDVGYGVSLQLPILFQAILSEHYTKEGETLLIEQPEVHLHPSLQAKFIEILASLGTKNSYFIETHSEHIVRKLQVLIKNGSYNLSPNDVTIHYFRREPLKFTITSHVIDRKGKLLPNFPSGFYDTSYSLVKELI